MSDTVLVVDPGNRTGWARCEIEAGQIVLDSLRQGVTPLKDFALAMGNRFSEYDTIVYETWRLYPEKAKAMIGSDFQPVQLIGMIRYLGWLNPTVTLVPLHPDKKKTGRKVMPDILSERLQYSTEEHDKDALDLLAYYWWEKYV